MKQKLSVFLVGILLGGAVIGVIGPVSAHHNSDFRTLNRKINNLQDSVRVLKNKTQAMDRDGFYNGFIGGFQVLSLCADQTNAIWETVPDAPELTQLDDCFVGARGARDAARRAMSR